MIDIGNTCVDCRESTAPGSGRWVNRIPAWTETEEGYMCVECFGGDDE